MAFAFFFEIARNRRISFSVPSILGHFKENCKSRRMIKRPHSHASEHFMVPSVLFITVGMYLRIIESKKRPETENIEILDALKIDNITKLKQISPFLGEMDLAQSDDVTGSKVQLLLKIMELSERRQAILESLKNNKKIDLHPIEILYEILRLVLYGHR